MPEKSLLYILCMLILVSYTATADEWTLKKQTNDPPVNEWKFTEETAFNFSKLALKCVHQEFPNKLSHVMNDEKEVLPPRTLHPAFYGCFDWHSSVHGHWMLVKLLKKFPDLRNAADIRSALSKNLTAENILAEVAYLHQPSRKSFERTYGWAWLLKLVEELHGWEDADGLKWRENLKPLEVELVKRYMEFLPKQTYPIRTGVHPNTAFGIAFAYDYAVKVGNEKFKNLLIATSLRYYQNDRNYPTWLEPGGEDFFSPSLMEADLMRRTMDAESYYSWFVKFFLNRPDVLLAPATVTDRSDPKIVHLDGLNLSRAWCIYGILSALPDEGKGRAMLIDSARRHLDDALSNVASGNYEGEHWLASFAVYALDAREKFYEKYPHLK